MIDEKPIIADLNARKKKYMEEHPDMVVPFIIDEFIQVLERASIEQSKDDERS